MQSANQTQMLSVRELNEILRKLQKKEDLSVIGTFSEVDIVFVAGLFLRYMQHKKDWIKIPKSVNGKDWINLSDNSGEKRDFIHSHYFKQIEKLYKVYHYQIFENFPNSESIKGQYQAKIYSSSFVPPIYITEENIDCFFRDKTDSNIEYVKNKYNSNFTILDFINKRKSNYTKDKNRFSKYENEIKERLGKFPPIFTFVFIVASKNLAIKKDESFERRKNYIEKLWLFTQDYVQGLYELAKNIVEHGGMNGQKGEGMITIRAYSDNKSVGIKILETHVFDYGEEGIIPKLIKYTKEKVISSDVKNKTIKQCYEKDNIFFDENKNYKLKDFISPQQGKELQQQTFRHTSHYGINKLYKLVTKTLTSNNYQSEIFVSSKGQILRDTFGNNAEKITLENGTHYYFKIPFVEDNFNNIEPKSFSRENQTAILGETASLEALSKITKISVNINHLSGISPMIENSLIDITIDTDDEKITKENVDDIYSLLNKLNGLNDNNKIAINLQDKITDVSMLLRFLSYITFEYKQPLIVYNIDYEIYKIALADNKDFYESRKPSEAYWHNERAILLFIKNNTKDFYFADILYGQNRDEFLFVNNIASKTFPNTITLLQEIDDKKKETQTDYINRINSNQNLQQFFYPETNTLYPFDALLANNDKPLFVSNLTTILQNPLIRPKQDYSNLNEYIENFDGFRIIDTHFRIGTKIHSEDFYYAKRLFQNSFYTTRLAMLLAIKIKEKIKKINKQIEEENQQKENRNKKQKINKITLVGYEMYSELLLSLIEKFLKDFGFKTIKQDEEERVNHFITTQSEDDNFKFLPNDVFTKYIEDYNNRCTIIIVPIAATGSTAKKIENDIKEQIYKQEKRTKKKTKEDARRLANEYSFFEPRYNILLAQPGIGFETIKQLKENQEAIITIPAIWHEIKDCKLCYGVDRSGNEVKTKVLFETDKSSLTPTLIFENPKGKKQTEEEAKTFDNLDFKDSLKYRKVIRNNKYPIYYIESYKFIENKNNLSLIKKWLKDIVKTKLNLNLNDKVIIISPCHESNSRFLNLVNEIVFSSSATIIHYQNNVDYDENFKLLNKNFLNEEIKLFYIDDSLITGKHFYEVFDLVSDNNDSPFTASIFLKDKSMQDIHNRIVKMSNTFFAFANFNQPPALNLLEQRPLEHERQRYETLSKITLHDVTMENFQQKANSLNPQKPNNKKEDVKAKDKEIRRLKCFEATHKIYDYFSKNPQGNNYDIKSIVSFREYSSPVNTDLFPQYSQEVEKKRAEERQDNPKALLKVLSQYPFILYQPLKKKTFDWLNDWFNEIEEPNTDCFLQRDYDNFQTIKFLLRRAVILGNYQVLKEEFLRKILSWFIKIDKYFVEKGKADKLNTTRTFIPLPTNEEDNLLDFPLYVLRNYVEMIQKNGWVAYHMKNNIEDLKASFIESKQGSQFLFMLQIESTLVIDDLYEMIKKEKYSEWRNIFNGDKNLNKETNKIVDFLKDDKNKNILNSNKYLIVKETFLSKTDELAPKTPFINYLWIKQLLFVDCDKDSYFPRDIQYQTKIDVIIEKMKEFFPADKNIQAFFVVTDGQHKPYVLKDEQSLLNNFCSEFEDSEKKNHKTQILINFLNGIKCNTGIAFETTAGYYRNCTKKEIEDEFYKNNEPQNHKTLGQDLFSNLTPDYNSTKWTDAYNRVEGLNLPFMPSDSKWLLLVRITKRNDNTDKFDTLGMLGFYSTENLYNSLESLLPKQLLMLLRKDMGKFIEKHHKNDEFSELKQQIERNKYIFQLNHGVNEYRNTINSILESCQDTHLKDDLRAYYNYLITKLDIISKLSSEERRFEFVSLRELKSKFYRIHWKALSLNTNISTSIQYLSKKNVTNLVKLDFIGFKNDKEQYRFPENCIEDIIFELLNNIRKNTFNMDIDLITPENPLQIDIAIINESNAKFLSITNNHVSNHSRPQKKDDKPHGIDLLKQIWNAYDLGKIIPDVYPLKDDSFTIKIQIKSVENEKSNNN